MTNPILPAGILADMKSIVTSAAINPCVVARTGVSTTCRVKAELAHVHLEGLPSSSSAPRWQLTFPAGTDVTVGDSITVTGMGTYVAILTENPSTWGAGQQVHAVQTLTASGGWPILTNQTVQFYNPRTKLTLTTSAFVHPFSYDGRLSDVGVDFDWIVVWNPAVTYSDSRHIGPGHQVIWSGFRAARNTVQMDRVRAVTTPLAYTMAHVKDSD